MKPRQVSPFDRGVEVEVLPESLGNDVIVVRSTSNPKTTYRVDTVRGRCSCPGWVNARNGPNGKKPPCRHLKAMGLKSMGYNA